MKGRRPQARTVVVLLVVVLGYYLVVAGARGLVLLESSRWQFEILGVGVLIAPLLAVPLILGELRFGRDTERLAGLLGEEHEAAELPRRPSGRVDRQAADALFAQRRDWVREAPTEWQRWFLLAEAYGDAGDTARGRRAMRRAITLERESRTNEGPA